VLEKAHTFHLGPGLKGHRRSIGIRVSVGAGHQCALDVGRCGGNQSPRLVSVDHLFVGEASLPHRFRPCFKDLQVGIALGKLDLAARLKSTVIAYQVFDPLPELERSDGERDLREVPSKAPHSARVHARSVPTDRVLLEDRDALAAERKMQGRGAAVQTSADDDHVLADRWNGVGHRYSRAYQRRRVILRYQPFGSQARQVG